uniref:glutathione transferase n=1 Tax=Steinernema glaseri TaxID=37863 RepID=A0A1I7ZFZ5_9BILA
MVYELIYFDARGIGEMARMLMTDQGIEYTEKRFSVVDRTEWLEFKKTYPFGQVPALNDGSLSIVQSGAIMLHLARKHNLYGTTEEDMTHADMFFEGTRELRHRFVQWAKFDWNVEGKREEYLTQATPIALGQMEKLLKTRQNGEHFVLGEQISFVDYALFEELDVLLVLEKTILDEFPVLKAFHRRMSDRPVLKEYLKKRVAAGTPITGYGRL